MTTRKFHISDVLSVTTGKLVSTRGIEGVYDIMSFLSGHSVFTHELIRCFQVYGPVLRERFPNLPNDEVKLPIVKDNESQTKNNIMAWIAGCAIKHGEEFELEPMPDVYGEDKGPISSLMDVMSDLKEK